MQRYFFKLIFGCLLLNIIQCKNSQSPNNSNSPSLSSSAVNSPSTCALSPQAVTQAMGLINLVKIDASQLKIQAPDYAIMEYTAQQKSLILQITPVASDDPNLYPDYARYKITDAKNHECASGRTGLSLIREIFLPQTCATGVLTISAQGCASSARLKNQNVPCGAYASTVYSHVVNPASSLANVLANLQEIDSQIITLANWLASRANVLLGTLGSSPQKLSSVQALLISLAHVFARNPSDFADIFSSSLYQQFIVLAQSKGLNTNGLHLADSSSDPCASNADQSTPLTLPNDGVSAAYSGVDIQQILQDAKANNVSTDTEMNNALTGADASSIAVSTSTVTNGAKAKTPSASNLAPYLTAAGLIAAGLVWGTVAMYYDAKSRAQFREFMKGVDPNLIDANGNKINIKKSRVEWVYTADADAKVMVYKNQVLTKDNQGRFKLEPLTEAFEKKPIYEFYKSEKLVTDVADQFFKPKATINDVNFRNIKTSDIKLPSLGHSAISVTLMAMGGLLAGYTSLNLASNDVFTNFMNDMKTAEQALDKILAQKNTLEKMKTDLVLSTLTQN